MSSALLCCLIITQYDQVVQNNDNFSAEQKLQQSYEQMFF